MSDENLDIPEYTAAGATLYLPALIGRKINSPIHTSLALKVALTPAREIRLGMGHFKDNGCKVGAIMHPACYITAYEDAVYTFDRDITQRDMQEQIELLADLEREGFENTHGRVNVSKKIHILVQTEIGINLRYLAEEPSVLNEGRLVRAT